jgi:hypothetical protein
MKISVEVTGSQASIDELSNKFGKFVSDFTSSLNTNLKARTPIDTGRARRGWTQRTQGTSASVENTVPYVPALEKGRSRQAPNGFVQQSVAATVNEFKRKGQI